MSDVESKLGVFDVVSILLPFSVLCAKCTMEAGMMLNVIGFITSVGAGGFTGLTGVELFTGVGSKLTDPFWIGFCSAGGVGETAIGLEMTVCSPELVLLVSSVVVSSSFTRDGTTLFLV
jgi:hypothetical protein